MRTTAILALFAAFFAFVACLLAVVGARLAERQAKQAMKLATEALAAARAAGAAAATSQSQPVARPDPDATAPFTPLSDAVAEESAVVEDDGGGVHWSVAWEAEAGILNLINVGDAPAVHVSAVIHGKKLHKAFNRVGDCAAGGGQVALDLAELVEMRREQAAKKNPKEFKPKFTLDVTWSSTTGHPESKSMNLVLG